LLSEFSHANIDRHSLSRTQLGKTVVDFLGFVYEMAKAAMELLFYGVAGKEVLKHVDWVNRQ
jgi:hypothetical protein